MGWSSAAAGGQVLLAPEVSFFTSGTESGEAARSMV
jgi:hypothetical protein